MKAGRNMEVSEKEIKRKNRNKKNKKYNDSYFYIIIFLIIIIFFETTYILFDKLVFIDNKDVKVEKENKQTQNLSTEQLIKYFKDKNYDFIMSSYEDSDFKQLSLIFSNDKITFFYKIYNGSISEEVLYYKNSDINDEYINILDEKEITNIEQYLSYKEWMEENNIELEQIFQMLFYYYQNNPEEVIYTNSDE